MYITCPGASLSTVGNNNDTLFHLAAFNGQLKVVRWLVKMGAKDVAKVADKQQRTVMHIAVSRLCPHPSYYLFTESFYDYIHPHNPNIHLDDIIYTSCDLYLLSLCINFNLDHCIAISL